MKPVRLIVVGQAKAPYFRDACVHYLEALRRYLPAEELIVRDGKSADPSRRKAEEAKAVLGRLLPRDFVVILDEHGTSLASRELAGKLRGMIEDPGRAPCFIIGGAFGLAPAVLAACRHKISLSPMTFTHEMARVLLMEQLYRADAILRGSPYHHE